jgi:hypothetical protein
MDQTVEYTADTAQLSRRVLSLRPNSRPVTEDVVRGKIPKDRLSPCELSQ